MARPIISCVMPTSGRRTLAGQAIRYFVRQDYPAKELIILDDGEPAVDDLAAGYDGVRYVRLRQRTSIAEKRRIGAELATGAVLAHWDDDDWFSPRWLSGQLDRLIATGAPACAASAVPHFDLHSARAWSFANITEGSLMYWQARGPAPSCPTEASPDYVGLIHGGNAGLRSFAEPCWRPRALADVLRFIEPDREFYAALRRGFEERPRECVAPVTLAAHFDISTGYGSMAEYLALGLQRCGVSVKLLPLSLRSEGLTSEFLGMERATGPDLDAPSIYYCWPRPELDRFHRCRNLFINTMWESDMLPQGWAPSLNRARGVFVPTHFVADTFRRCGVTAPIEVIPEGLDPDTYHWLARPERAGLVTLTVGPIDGRKHVREGIAAWKKAFAGDADARLIIKTAYGYHNYTPDDPRIQYVDAVETTRGIAHWYQQADVLLALGSEGFGLPAVEAMATGLPVVVLDSEGQSDLCRDAKGLVLPVPAAGFQEVRDPIFGDCGKRGVPDVEAAAAALRWVGAHREEAVDLGAAASRWAIRHRSVWQKAAAMLQAMERSVEPARPLRKQVPVWVASAGSACGIAEYASDLSAALPSAKVQRSWPKSVRSPLIHIEHEYSLYSNADMDRRIREARREGKRTVVTQHTVTLQTSAWQADADALIALTANGASALRAQYPNQRIEHIPHGCHSWFPERKRKRGRVIGLFGFLERYKGFFAVLEALKQLPDCELLAFSHGKTPALEAAWDQAAAGLPVRRNPEFLAVGEIARHLAAEADILVFWYDEPRFWAASGAACIGLATGVPVLTSKTRWFADFQECTLQSETLVGGITELLSNENLRSRIQTAARDYCLQNSWQRTAGRHASLWRSLEVS